MSKDLQQERKRLRSSDSKLDHPHRVQKGFSGITAVILMGAAMLIAEGAAAAEEATEAADIWDAITGGRAHLDLRARIEVADTDALKQSEAYTIRTRLGYGTKPLWGVSAYADFENIAAIEEEQYWNGADPADPGNGKTKIADPTGTELNQAYLKWSRQDFLGATAMGGRQRLILDDARFVGNVGWRQNEQTYDAAVAKTSLGVEGLQLLYAYIWDVNRIFGNRGGATTRNWDSSSHLANASFSRWPYLKVATFGYFLDFDSSPANSSNTVGLRLHGEVEVVGDLGLGYTAAYAYQWDGGRGAGENPTEYDAHYCAGEARLDVRPAGAMGAGYELLGSDGGNAVFVTPLATLHGFNGWADVFLNNGGDNGLQDIYVYLAPELPWGMTTKLVYHHFRSHEGNDKLGNELDAVVSKAVNENFSVLAKAAYYNDDGNNAGHTVRGWLQATLTF